MSFGVLTGDGHAAPPAGGRVIGPYCDGASMASGTSGGLN